MTFVSDWEYRVLDALAGGAGRPETVAAYSGLSHRNAVLTLRLLAERTPPFAERAGGGWQATEPGLTALIRRGRGE